MPRQILCKRLSRRLSFPTLISVIFAAMYITISRLPSQYPDTGVYHYDNKLTPDNDNNMIQDNDITEEEEQVCVHPSLELWHPDLVAFFKDPEPLKCNQVEENWVYVSNGTFRISSTAERKYGDIVCEYLPILRGKDDFEILEGTPIRPMLSGMPIDNDYFEAKCVSKSGKVYHNLHIGIAKKKSLHQRQLNLPDNSMGFNILMFGFDSISRMAWMRNLPKSYDYFMNELHGHVLEGYNIVGDGTPQALIPILVGKNETELPESRRGHTERTVDEHPWIWRDLRKAGFITQWGEDGQKIGTFTYRMNGFKEQPVDHYMRPYYLRAERQWYEKNHPFCLGSTPRHQNMLKWILDTYNMYPDKLKFSFLFHSEMSHSIFSQLKIVDEDFKSFLDLLNTKGYLDNTILVLMADHGARFVDARQTIQGKYEERMPFFAFRFPERFIKKYPKAYENFRTNTHRLTTPYDIHATFHDILSYDSNPKLSKPLPRGISLFKDIPLSRSCKDAHIAPHWCACLQWQNVPVTDVNVLNAANALLDTINGFLTEYFKLCSKLSIGEIHTAVRYGDNDVVLKFKKSADTDGRAPDLSDKMGAYVELYQLTLTTLPGRGQFEATIKHNLHTGTFSTSVREISRINRYGNAPHCVQEQFPHLRAYCYCIVQLS